MRVSVRVVACAVVMLVGTPRPADAIWRWLEHMSGPGWYDGFSIEWKLKCAYPKDLPATTAEALSILERTHSRDTLEAFLEHERDTYNRPEVVERLRALLFPYGKLPSELQIEQQRVAAMAGGLSLPCSEANKVGDTMRPRRAAFGLAGGLLWSTINRLRYAPGIDPADTQVWVVTGGPYYDHRLWGLLNRVEVGASLEGYLFFGSTTRTMARLALEPRATVTLGTIRDDATGRPAIHLKVRVGALWVVPGFDPEDFGALPGERLGPEVLTSVRLVIDFECKPWKRGSC